MERVCPDKSCPVKDKDACFSCGYDSSQIIKGRAVSNAIKLLEERLDTADTLINKLYESGCLDIQQEELVQFYLSS